MESLVSHLKGSLTIDVELDQQLVAAERENHALIPEPVRLAIYRIAEDSLTNVIKHSNASRAVVEGQLSSKTELKLLVKDDGKGFDLEEVTKGMGSMSMQDYANLYGGQYWVVSKLGKGTEVRAIIPFNSPAKGSQPI